MELGLARGMFFAPPQAEGPKEINGAAAAAEAKGSASGVPTPKYGDNIVVYHYSVLINIPY